MNFYCVNLIIILIFTINGVKSMIGSNESDTDLDVYEKETTNRLRRFVSFNIFQSKEYKSCTAVGNVTGLCKPIHKCILDEIKRTNFGVMKNTCITESLMIGICCPIGDEKNETLSEKLDIDPRNNLDADNLGRPQIRDCGLNAKSRTRIVGGRPADPKEWPWMAALIRRGDARFCGGVLVTNRHVISAAHCTINLRPQDVIVRLGEYDFTKTDESESKNFRAISIIQHPGFNDSSFLDDISILKLHRFVIFDDYIWPICLPIPDDSFDNKTASVTGWGSVGFAEAMSDVLMEVDIPIWPHDMCKAAYKEMVIPDTSLCAGGWRKRKDSCQGDSGGPLMHKLRNGRWITVGIVSWGSVCGQPLKPGIYTRVNKYLPWIVENTI